MKAAKITAKIRDAVPVEFYEDGNERAVYKNIEIPDSLKALEIKDFRFITPEDGKISFRLYFAPYTLPEIMPEPKPPVTREQRRAAKAAKAQQPGADAWSEAANEYNAPENPGEPSDDIAAYLPAPGEDYTITTPEGAVIAEIHHGEVTDEAPAEEPDEDEDAPEADEPAAIRFDVPGKKRGALARAIADYTGDAAEYLNPPSYAYQIGTLGLERDGSLIGELPDGLLEALAEQGFTPAE